MVVNHKRVARLMREDNLLAIEPRAFVQTTDSDHELKVYLNLAARMQLTGINQLWVADITYIRLRQEFVYLALVLDAFSRKVVGWALDRSLAAQLPLAALEQAIAQRQPLPGLVHHSDRGIQYACQRVYGSCLHIHGMLPSMSRPGNPYDNAFCESFIKTLKREEIYANNYQYDRRPERSPRGVHRALLQSPPASLGAWIHDPGGVRSCPRAADWHGSSEHEFFKAWGNLSILENSAEAGHAKQTGSQCNPAPQLIGSMSLQSAIP